MQLEQYHEMWEKDSPINPLDLIGDLVEQPRLFSKYIRFRNNEYLLLKKKEEEMNVLKKDKFEFYTQGHNTDSLAKGWEYPPKGIVIKSEAHIYIAADKDIIVLNLRIEYLKEVVKTLDYFVNMISFRKNVISEIMNIERFQAGEGKH